MSCALRMSNHELGCELEAIAAVLEMRGYPEMGKILERFASDLK